MISNELIMSLMIWISTVTGFTIPKEPNIKFTTYAEMKYITYDCDNITPKNKEVCKDTSIGEKTLALYNHTTKTIYLSNDFWPASTKDQSILLHELVHHMQFTNNYQDSGGYCGAPSMEAQAYSVQSEWLKKYGMSLEKDIGVGPLYLYVLTACRIGPS